MARTHFSGPVQSAGGFRAGATGTDIAFIEKGVISVATTALAASTNLDIAIAVADAAVGDQVLVTPPNAAMEANLSILAAWVSAAGTLTIRIRNSHATVALTGSTTNWSYMLAR